MYAGFFNAIDAPNLEAVNGVLWEIKTPSIKAALKLCQLYRQTIFFEGFVKKPDVVILHTGNMEARTVADSSAVKSLFKDYNFSMETW